MALKHSYPLSSTLETKRIGRLKIYKLVSKEMKVPFHIFRLFNLHKSSNYQSIHLIRIPNQAWSYDNSQQNTLWIYQYEGALSVWFSDHSYNCRFAYFDY